MFLWYICRNKKTHNDKVIASLLLKACMAFRHDTNPFVSKGIICPLTFISDRICKTLGYNLKK